MAEESRQFARLFRPAMNDCADDTRTLLAGLGEGAGQAVIREVMVQAIALGCNAYAPDGDRITALDVALKAALRFEYADETEGS